LESVKESIKYAHLLNKKAYITFNIFAHNHHIDNFLEKKEIFSEFLNGEFKPDAVIVSDIGMMGVIKEIAPKMDIHVSTQANTLNYRAVEEWKKFGVTRVILGREATLSDIKIIKEKNSDIEIECFVHGAMCMSYSGRCFLSKYFLGTSANLGACSHPCRWKYSIKEDSEKDNNEEKKSDIFGNEREIILTEDENGSYLFNSHDLCLIEYLKELKDTGVTCFKIEGRTKSIYYIAQVVKAYRTVLDLIDNNEYDKEKEYWKIELNKLVNRGYTTGFLFNEAKSDPSSLIESHLKNEYRFAGEVVDISKLEKYHPDLDKNLNFVFVHNKINVGDDLEIISITGRNFITKIEKIIDPDNLEELETISAGFDKIVGMKFMDDLKLENMVLIVRKEMQ